MSFNVRLLIGANAYACVKSDEPGNAFSMDILLSPGKSAADSIQETIRETGERVRREMIRMERMQRAADILRAQDAARRA